jgi:hypothetical protein
MIPNRKSFGRKNSTERPIGRIPLAAQFRMETGSYFEEESGRESREQSKGIATAWESNYA